MKDSAIDKAISTVDASKKQLEDYENIKKAREKIRSAMSDMMDCNDSLFRIDLRRRLQDIDDFLEAQMKKIKFGK